MSSSTEAARLYWGGRNDCGREGWWLVAPDGRVGMVHENVTKMLGWIEKRTELYIIRLVQNPKNYSVSEDFTLLMELEQIWRVWLGPEPALESFRRATHPSIDFALEVLHINSAVNRLDQTSPPPEGDLVALRDRVSRAVQGALSATAADRRSAERLREAQHVLDREWPLVPASDLTDPVARQAHARDMAASLRQQARWIRQMQGNSDSDRPDDIDEVDVDELEAAAELIERLAAVAPASPARPKRPRDRLEPAHMRDLRSWSRHMNDERLIRLDFGSSNRMLRGWFTAIRYTDGQGQDNPSLRFVDSRTCDEMDISWKEIWRVRVVADREIPKLKMSGHYTSLRSAMQQIIQREEATHASSTVSP